MVYLASHGSRAHVLEGRASAARARAARLRRRCAGLLDAAGIRWRIIVVSACYSGGFIDALQDDNTLSADGVGLGPRVVRLRQRTATARSSAKRCSSMGSRNRIRFSAAFDAAKERVASREKEGKFKPPSMPQMYIGPAMADKLKELDRGNAARRTGRSV